MRERVAWAVVLTALTLGLVLPLVSPSGSLIAAFALVATLGAAAILGVWRLVTTATRSTRPTVLLARHEQRVEPLRDARYARMRDDLRAYVDRGEHRAELVHAFAEGLTHVRRLPPEEARDHVEAHIPATNGHGDPGQRAEAVRLLRDDLTHKGA